MFPVKSWLVSPRESRRKTYFTQGSSGPFVRLSSRRLSSRRSMAEINWTLSSESDFEIAIMFKGLRTPSWTRPRLFLRKLAVRPESEQGVQTRAPRLCLCPTKGSSDSPRWPTDAAQRPQGGKSAYTRQTSVFGFSQVRNVTNRPPRKLRRGLSFHSPALRSESCGYERLNDRLSEGARS